MYDSFIDSKRDFIDVFDSVNLPNLVLHLLYIYFVSPSKQKTLWSKLR